MLTDNKSGIVTSYQHWHKVNDKSYVGFVNAYHKHRFDNASVLDFLWQLSLIRNINKVNQTEDDDRELHSYLYDFHNSRVVVSFTPSYQFRWLGFDAKICLNTYFQSNRVREQKEVSSIFKHREWDEYLYLDVNRAWGGFSLVAS